MVAQQSNQLGHVIRSGLLQVELEQVEKHMLQRPTMYDHY